MIASILTRRRLLLVVGTLLVGPLLIWFLPYDYSATWESAKDTVSNFRNPATSSSSSTSGPKSKPSKNGIPVHVENYFEQVFSAGYPRPFPYAALKDTCDHAPWRDDDVYLKCGGMSAGLTSIVSQIKVCFKMALDAGTHLILPAMPLRDSTNLLDYNFLNQDAYMTYDQWFDADHLIEQLGKACPRMKIVHPKELDQSVPVKHRWGVSCGDAPNYRKIHSYFWAGRPFKSFFDGQLRRLVAKEAEEKKDEGLMGITVVDIDSEFLLYKITDDPTHRDLRLWNDLSHLVRFREEPRRIIDRLVKKFPRPYYGVHFRVENDTIWSSLDHQLGVDLDALDRAWEMYGTPGAAKPLVYLACGDEKQMEKFVEAGEKRGWEVTHKWRLAGDDAETKHMIDDLAFDFQGAVDMGIMVRSQFFMGITGSAFSSTIANQRDITGRYRGSSFEVLDDEEARTHLFNDLDAEEYSCCL